MFTIHTLDVDGNLHKELARTEFSDIARVCAFAIVRQHWPEDSSNTQVLAEEGSEHLLIQRDGKPYEKIVFRRRTDCKWVVEDA